MWKFTAKYENYNGEHKEKELFFNLNKHELRRLSVSVPGGIDTYYKKIVEAEDNKAIYESFEDLIHLSYGITSADGESFEKSEEEWEKFKSSMAYESFMDYIFGTENGAVNFVNGIMPASLRNQVKEISNQ